MARVYGMTWEPCKLRWRKMYRGKTYTISCDALDAPPNKEGSYQAANRWWESRFTAIQEPPPCRFDWIIQELIRRKAWVISQGMDAGGYDGTIEKVRELSAGETHPFISSEILSSEIIAKNWDVWQDRLSRDPQPAPQTDRTVGHWVNQYLRMREVEVKSGDLSVSSYDSIRLCLDHFKGWLGAGLPVDKLDSARWLERYKAVHSLEISVSYKRKRFIFAKAFIGWLVEQGVVPGYASLSSKRYQFGADDKEVEPLSVDQVRGVVGASTGILRLILMLMLNTGMTVHPLKPCMTGD